MSQSQVPGTCSPDGAFQVGRDMSGRRVMDAPYLPGAAADRSDSGTANHEESVLYAANPSAYHVIETVHFSYSTNPAAGSKLTIEVDGSPVFSAYITSGGPGPLCLSPALVAPKGAALEIKLSAGGVGVLGSLVCRHYALVDVSE